jgi:hypothetical protein
MALAVALAPDSAGASGNRGPHSRGTPFHMPAVGRVRQVHPGIFSLRAVDGTRLLTHGPDPAFPSVPTDLAFTSSPSWIAAAPTDQSGGSGARAPGGGDGTTATYICNFDATLTFSPAAHIPTWFHVFDQAYSDEPNSGTYSGSPTSTCVTHDTSSPGVPQTATVTLPFSGNFVVNDNCLGSVSLTGSVTPGGSSFTHGTDMTLDAQNGNGTLTIDGTRTTPLTVTWNHSPTCWTDQPTVEVQGQLLLPADEVPTSTADGPNACDTVRCDDGATDPDPCGSVPCDQPPDPCSTVDCSPVGFSATVRRPSCVTDAANGYYFEAFYVHPKDRPSRYRHLIPALRTTIARMNARLYDEARRSSGNAQAARYKFLCDSSSRVVVAHFRLTTAAGNTRNLYSTIVNDAKTAGVSSSHAKYLIFYDGRQPTARLPNGQVIRACGQGDLPGDDTLATTNRTESGPDYAIAYGTTCWAPRYPMHETTHTMGAVQNSAPHASGGGHCNDGLDVMCYADGGSKSRYNPNVCTNRVYFDCRYDDYFDTRPATGSYLATHWNLGWSGNQFLAFP